MKCPDLKGQVLDGKYMIERELGRGGMGTVYLATHLGTERPVAVKIIAPQFMQRTEFVERFRREARAAGRLRHPNVVNVTDFGFSDTTDGQVAYLVMEYLDGCTLGEILDEERNLPVGWTLDILDQVCSAVHEAHLQGIIHRDLKPDNIWLEPNLRGGYTVKVLDFGIAKLEDPDAARQSVAGSADGLRAANTLVENVGATIGDASGDTIIDKGHDTLVAEAATVSGSAANDEPPAEIKTLMFDQTTSEGETAIYDTEVSRRSVSRSSDGESVSRISASHSLTGSRGSAELTRVGAVLGTPLYMSPEQCAGESLDPRSDIYSLGVIAYQMLSGRTPFEGDYKDVMDAHKSLLPPPLKARKVRRKMKKAIHSALEKDPDRRPQSAEGFASLLRARTEGIFGLLRRALVIYSEHLPKFVLVSAFFSIPIIILSVILLVLSFLKVSEVIPETTANIWIGIDGFALTIASAFCVNLIIGSISWIVSQYLAVPLRPVRIRPALKEARRKWKRIAGAGLLTATLPFVFMIIGAIAGFAIGAVALLMFYPLTGSLWSILGGGVAGSFVFAALAFFAAYISFILVAPVVMLENIGVIAALKRSRELVKRSYVTSMGAVAIMFLIPAIIAGTISFVVNVSARAFDPKPKDEVVVSQSNGLGTASGDQEDKAQTEQDEGGIRFGINPGRQMKIFSDDADMRAKLKTTFLESLIQILWLPMQIFVFSFSAIIVALLYMKTRLAGGESMNELIERFEDDGRPRKKWQERVRQRLIQSGRIPSKP